MLRILVTHVFATESSECGMYTRILKDAELKDDNVALRFTIRESKRLVR